MYAFHGHTARRSACPSQVHLQSRGACLLYTSCVPNVCIQLWGGAVRPFPSDWAKAVIRIGNIAIPRADILAAVLSVIMLILLWCFLYKTKTGLGIRASAFDSNTAGLMGINAVSYTHLMFIVLEEHLLLLKTVPWKPSAP